MTAPPTTPTESDQVKVAAIQDRLARLRRLPSASLGMNRATSGSTRWEPGPTGPLTFGPDFYGLPADARRHRAQVELVLRAMLSAAPDISSGFVDKYVQMIEQIRQQKGALEP